MRSVPYAIAAATCIASSKPLTSSWAAWPPWRAASAGVPTRLDVWPEMPHVWHLFHPILTAGRKAIEEGGAFVKAAMTTGAPFTHRA